MLAQKIMRKFSKNFFSFLSFSKIFCHPVQKYQNSFSKIQLIYHLSYQLSFSGDNLEVPIADAGHQTRRPPVPCTVPGHVP